MNKLGIFGVVIIAVVIVGSTTLVFADEEKNFFKKIANQLKKIAEAIEGLDPTVTVNVEPTPITVNVGSEPIKNVIKANSKTGTILTCPDNSQIIDNRAKTIAMNEFGNLPNLFGVDNQSGSGQLFLEMYTAETDGITFEITGIGETRGGAGTCGFASVPFTFSITGQCSEATQVDVATSIGISVTMNADVACI